MIAPVKSTRVLRTEPEAIEPRTKFSKIGFLEQSKTYELSALEQIIQEKRKQNISHLRFRGCREPERSSGTRNRASGDLSLRCRLSFPMEIRDKKWTGKGFRHGSCLQSGHFTPSREEDHPHLLLLPWEEGSILPMPWAPEAAETLEALRPWQIFAF